MQLVNQQTSIPLPRTEDAEHKATFADLIKIVVDAKSGTEGCTISQMRLRLGIVEQCEAEPDVLKFTAEQTLFLKEVVPAHKWGAHHRELMALWDAIEAADAPQEQATHAE